jgi:hypothetical protein
MSRTRWRSSRAISSKARPMAVQPR